MLKDDDKPPGPKPVYPAVIGPRMMTSILKNLTINEIKQAVEEGRQHHRQMMEKRTSETKAQVQFDEPKQKGTR